MGLFKKEKELGIDIGSHNIRFVNSEGEVILDERSLVVISKQTGKIVCVGDEAYAMAYYYEGKYPFESHNKLVAPYKKEKIVDFQLFESMVKIMAKRARYKQSQQQWEQLPVIRVLNKLIKTKIINGILIFVVIIISLPFLIPALMWDEFKREIK